MNAPPAPVNDSPTASATGLSACHSTKSPVVDASSPHFMSAAGEARRASALTASVPSRYVATLAVPISPARA